MHWKISLLTLLLFSTSSLFAQSPQRTQKFLQKKARPILLSDTTDFSDLKALKRALKNKRIVLLGESTHGAQEMNLLKNRLIRFLHQELDFQVLLLESGIGEIFSLDQRKQELSAHKMRYAGLMGPWQSEEFVPLMAYLKKHPDLALAGFDVQRTGQSFVSLLEQLDQWVTIPGHPSLVEIEHQFSAVRTKLTDRKQKADEALAREKSAVIAALTAAQTEIRQKKNERQLADWTDQSIEFLLRSLQNRIDFIQYFYQFKLDNDYVHRFMARDSVMAENVRWLAEQIYPGKKIIISAHNHHISRFNERDFVMGEKLAEIYGQDLYAIGLFPGSGSFADNSRKEEAMETTGRPDDLQHLILQSGQKNAFLPVPKRPGSGAEWLFQPLTINNTFINIWGDDQMTLADSFDGLIFLREISPSVYR